jgi:hypothetical protein
MSRKAEYDQLGARRPRHKPAASARYNNAFRRLGAISSMNASATGHLLSDIELAPRDPILGVTDAFNADARPVKVNLGVGVYCDDNGKLPLLECVKRAERQIAESPAPRGYLPIDGIAAYDKAVRELLFDAESEIVTTSRGVTVQALGGTGGLKIGADFLRKFAPGAQVWISDPSWENHRALFEGAGFVVNQYAYYARATRGLDFGGMQAALEKVPAESIVVLHACCHNPTGVDPTAEQWATIIDIVRNRGLVPFLDIAYQGFGDDLHSDAAVVRPGYLAQVERDFVIPYPARMLRVPPRRAPVRDNRHTRRIQHHPQRILHRFIRPPVNRDVFALDPVAVAVLAEKHAVSETGSNAGDIRRDVKDPGREQQRVAFEGTFPSFELEPVGSPGCANDLVPEKPRVITPGLRPGAFQQLHATDPIGEPEIVLHIGFPSGHRFP